MTDRDMLEAAARAAGYSIGYWWELGTWHHTHQRYAGYGFPGHPWNPLTDDGDALRLAVKLGIHITNSDTDAWASTVGTDATLSLAPDPYAATRRAIVRAAAAMAPDAAKASR